MSTDQFLRGLQNIECSIISKASDAGVPLTVDCFQWHRGKGIVPPPEAIELEIHGQGRRANAVLPREQVEDSWERIHPAVMAVVRAIVADLARPMI